MSVISVAKRIVRIVALPLTTPPRMPSSGPHGPAEHLTYYHIVTPSPQGKVGWAQRVQNKAADMWAGLGKSPEGTWKHKAFVYGEQLVDRVDFEELALKSFDTSLGPKLLPVRRKDNTDHPTISIIYPPSVCDSPIPHLHSLLEKRTPSHRRGFALWLAISPLTAPLKLIPIIPNFPFFFCAWRAWSHYRAFKASQYLESFVAQGAILIQPSSELDAIYAKYAPIRPDPEAPGTPQRGLDVEASEKPAAATGEQGTMIEAKGPNKLTDPRLLLTHAAVPALERALGIPHGENFAADVYRALEQARLRLEAQRR